MRRQIIPPRRAILMPRLSANLAAALRVIPLYSPLATVLLAPFHALRPARAAMGGRARWWCATIPQIDPGIGFAKMSIPTPA